jgi:hypothetical protein
MIIEAYPAEASQHLFGHVTRLTDSGKTFWAAHGFKHQGSHIVIVRRKQLGEQVPASPFAEACFHNRADRWCCRAYMHGFALTTDTLWN